ncbi:3828_t:CDS:2 [Rhizophagus irregularis]|nr:3828_t:CDS:2 [Rhizophagus irregularis]
MYLNLVYGSNGEEEDSEMYLHRQFNYQRRGNTQNQGRGRRRGGASTSHPVEPNLDDINIVEYLQSVNTEGLLQKVRVAIYLSLDELWPVPSNIMLVATFLDPRFKNFDWCNGNDKDEAKELVQVLYNDAKKNISPRDSINSIITSSSDDDDIFKALKSKETNHKLLLISNRFGYPVAPALNANQISEYKSGQTELSKNWLEPNFKPVGATGSKL